MKDKKEILQGYEKKVVDLSRRNRLLKYPKNARAIDFDITFEEFQQKFGILEEFTVEFPHKEILHEEEAQKSLLNVEELPEQVEEEKKYIPFTKPKGEKLLSTFSSLRLDTKRKFEEHGLHTLFITFGKIKWKEQQSGRGSSQATNEYDYNAPILLVPVQIQEKKNPKKTIVTAYLEGNDITVNKVVSLLLEKEYNTRAIILKEDLLENLPDVMNDLASQIKAIFEELKITFEITSEIQIGQYSFYGQQIYEDIQQHEERFLENSFLDSLCTHTPIQQDNLEISTENLDDFLKPETDFNILDADTSQLAVIQKVLAGNHLNVQGPPGTGKSQTIVNLISNLLAREKTILLVCEKQVALEVVLNRLKEKGLEKLCLPLFKYNADKKTFAKSVIDDRDSIAKMVFNSYNLNTSLVEREQHIYKLRQYAMALGQIVDPLGKTIYWVHGELVRNKSLTSQTSIPWRTNDPLTITYEDYRKVMTLFESITPVINISLEEEHKHWQGVQKEHFSPDFVSRINNILKEIDVLLVQYQELSLKFFTLDSVHELKNYISISDAIDMLKENYEELESNYELYKASSILNEGKMLAEEYFELLKNTTKKYQTPYSWDNSLSSILEKNLQQTALLSDLSDSASAWEDMQECITKVKNELKSVQKRDLLENTSIDEILKYKNIYNIDPVIKMLKSWDNLIALQSAANQLHNLNTIYKRLNEIKNTFDKWGIISSTINKEQAQNIADKFINKYNKFWRKLYSQYKHDCKIVAEWCNASLPSKHNDYEEIIKAIHDWLRLEEKFNVLRASFSEEHIKKGELIEPHVVPHLDLAVNEIIDSLTTMKQDSIPSKLASFIEENDNHSSIREIIKNYEKIQDTIGTTKKYLQSEDILNELPFKKFEEIYSHVKKIFDTTLTLYQNTINLLDKNEYPLTVENLTIDAQTITPLALNVEKIKKLNLDKLYKSTDVISMILNDNESYTQLVADINNTKKTLSKIKTNAQNEITFQEAGTTIKEIKEMLPHFKKWLEKYENLLLELHELFGNDEGITHLEKFTFKDFSNILNNMNNDQEGLGKWMLYRKYERQIKELGYGWFLEDSKQTKIDNPSALFAVSLWNAWLDSYYKKTPALKNFTVRDHTQIIKEFRDLEQKVMDINALRILEKASINIKEAKWKQGVLDNEIIHQSQLQKRHKPIRKLVSTSGQQLITYKKCWMMSPLTLSSYIPFGSLSFDVVIFDEASQMRVEHALGSIARAKQVVIFGDENQLPPTSFFEVNNDDSEDDDESGNDYESILQVTKEILPGADEILSYHYRSKYEDLITYSNHYIYNDNLITFPNPKHNPNAVEFVYVESGVFDTGATRRNDIEAQKVAELCMDYASDQPNKSLGVIAFSKAQEGAIRDAVNTLLEKHPHLQPILDEESDKLEKFFIKNLESVQGDERDIIILSVGYGKDKNGNMYQRFGPITSPTGFRRLNVAVTRAKEQIVCVASIKAADVISESKSRGVQLLQKYLDYAEHGISTITASKLGQNNANISADSSFEEDVEKELQKVGMIVERQVGASGYKIDLAIFNPNKKEYVLGIECDGAQYHSSYSARVNDRIRQENLNRLGWNIYRIWSQHWILNKEQIIDDIINSLS